MDNMLPVFGMMIGIPGSGKTSWIAKQPTIDHDGCTYIRTPFGEFHVLSPDERRKKLSNITDQSRNAEIWQEITDHAVTCLKHFTNVLIDATNVQTTPRKKMLSRLPECKKVALIFNTDPVVACGRIKADLEANKERAAVPDEIVYRMYGDFLYTMRVLHAEGFETFSC